MKTHYLYCQERDGERVRNTGREIDASDLVDIGHQIRCYKDELERRGLRPEESIFGMGKNGYAQEMFSRAKEEEAEEERRKRVRMLRGR